MPDLTFASALAVFAGGGIGSLLRFMISKTSVLFFGSKFPYGTLFANTLGALLAGYAAVLIFERRSLAAPWSDFLLAGFLGGLTTFSSMVLDAHKLAAQNAWFAATVYILLNLLAGFLLFYLAFRTAANG